VNDDTIFVINNLRVWYGAVEAVRNISCGIRRHEILGIIGPANSGKTSFLRTLNRLNDLVPSCRTEGEVLLNGVDIYSDDMPVPELRKRVGMVFALPVPLPMSIMDNITYGPRMQGIRSRSTLSEITEKCLRAASLWDEVKDRLHVSAFRLSGGQQQRLCIARTLALQPDVILFDEPCSGLDPISTAKVEATMVELKQRHTIVLVTNNTKQASRVSDRVAFFLQGELVEIGATDRIFTAPRDRRTEDYIAGRFG